MGDRSAKGLSKKIVKGKRPSRRFLDYLRIMLHLRASPESIAWGLCIGLFVGFSPFFGLHIVLAILMAVLLRGSRVAAFVTVWISNPFTLVPLYSFTYYLGTWFCPAPAADRPLKQLLDYVMHHFHCANLAEFKTKMVEMAHLSEDVLLPLLVGGAVAGIISSAICYPVALTLIRRHRIARSHRLRTKKNRLQNGSLNE